MSGLVGGWLALSYVDGSGRFKMRFNVSEASLELVKSRLEAEGGSNFAVVAQPCHYSPEGLREAGLSAAAASVGG